MADKKEEVASKNDDLLKKMLDIEGMVKEAKPQANNEPYFDEMLRGQKATISKLDQVIKVGTATNEFAAAISSRMSTPASVEKPSMDAEQAFYKEMWNGLYKRLDTLQAKLNSLPLEKNTESKLSSFFKSIKNQTQKPEVNNINVAALQASVTNIEKYVGSLETLSDGVAKINELLKERAPLTLAPETIAKMTTAIGTLQQGNRDNEYLQQVKQTLATIEKAQTQTQQLPADVVTALNKLAAVDFTGISNNQNAGLLQNQIDELRKLESVDSKVLEQLTKMNFEGVKESIEKSNVILQKIADVKPNEDVVNQLKGIDFTPLQELKGFAELVKKAMPEVEKIQQTKPETVEVVKQLSPSPEIVSKSFDDFAKFDFDKLTKAFAPFEALNKIDLEPLAKLPTALAPLDALNTINLDPLTNLPTALAPLDALKIDLEPLAKLPTALAPLDALNTINLDPLTKLSDMVAPNSAFNATMESLKEMKPFSFSEIQASLAKPVANATLAPLPKMEVMSEPLLNQRVEQEATIALGKQAPILTDMLASSLPTIFTPQAKGNDVVDPMINKQVDSVVKPADETLVKPVINDVRADVSLTKVETPSIQAEKKPEHVHTDLTAILEKQQAMIDKLTTLAPTPAKEETSETPAVQATTGPTKADPQAEMLSVLRQIAQNQSELLRFLSQPKFNKSNGLDS